MAIISLLAAGCSQYNAQPYTAPSAPAVSEAAPGTGSTEAETNAVTISSFAFNPQEITIKAGGSITWTNLDSAPHTVKFEGFESERMGNGGRYEHAFMEPGEYDYICSIHPSMKGKVIVQ
ncbi:MAG TPA: cupredoxin family copper-binding protein [Nanoarchaeota archaeon]|nr:cupredoxin family copper-binding protein [Nanoarchaeota archaeon]